MLAAIAAGCANAGDPGLSSDSSFETGGTDGPDDPGSTGDTDAPEPEDDADASTSGESPEDPDDTGSETDGNDTCGDEIVDPDEACDDGMDNGTYGHCLADCSGMGPTCGDGGLDPQEVCDDGNTEDDDICSADCQVPGPAVWSVPFDGSWHQSVEEAADLVWQGDTLYVAVNERDLIGSSRTHVVTLDSDGTILEDQIQAPAAHELHAAAPKPDGIIAVGSIGGDAGSQVEIGGQFNVNTTASWPDVTAWTDVAVDPITANQAFLGTTADGWRMTLDSGGLTHSLDTWVPIYATDFFSDGDLVVAGVGSLGAPVFARNTTELDAIDQYTHDVASGTLWTVHDIEVGPSDTVYAVGEMHPNDQEGSTRGFIIVLSPELERIWSTLEVSGSRSVWRSVAVANNGDVVVAGNFDAASTGRVRKLDAEGNPVWTEELTDHNLQLTAVALDDNGSPYVAGHTTTNPTDGPTDVIITRLVP